MDDYVLQDMFYNFEDREIHGAAFEYQQGYSDGLQDCGNRTLDLTDYVQSIILFLIVVVLVISRHSYGKKRY